MTRQKKLFWMFSPLLVGFIVLYVGINDISHPSVEKDKCHVVGTGPAVTALRTPGNVLYQHSNDALNDVGLNCTKLGVVVLNDHEPFVNPIPPGAAATVMSRTYHFLPKIWHIEIVTGEDTTQL